MGKPAFDPTKKFDVVDEKPPFDPSKPFQSPEPDVRDKSSPALSLGAGAVQGATLGFGDELGAAGNALIDKVTGQPGTYSENYNEWLRRGRNLNDEARQDNPKLYLAGNVGGSLATALVPGAGALKGAGFIKTVGQNAALGAIAAAGDSESNPFRSPDEANKFASDIEKGGAIGSLFGVGGYAAGKALKALSPIALREYANSRALTASGFMAKDIKNLSPEQRQEIGRQLLDNKVVTAFSGLDDIAEKSGALKETAGESIGNALSTVDTHVKDLVSGIDSGRILQGASDEQKNIAKKYINDNFQFNMRNVGDRIKNELIAPNVDNPLVTNELSRLETLADNFSSKDSKSLGFGNLIKSTQGKQTRFQSDTVPELFKQDVYRIIKEELENSVGKTGNLEYGASALGISSNALGGTEEIAMRNSQTLGAYKDAKDLYGAMKAAENASTSRLGQTNVNRSVSLTDYIAGGAGMASGGPVPAVILGGLNKIARKYGASTQAVTADALASGIEAVKSLTTDQLAKAIGSVVSQSPELAQKVGGVLAKAATEGKISLVAVHYALMKEPKYRAAFQDNSQPENAFQRRLNQK